MTYQIDQSGKIEQTNKDTILCLSNGSRDTICIEATTKRQLQEIFRRNGQIRNYVLFTFCAGLKILIQRNPTIKFIIIDQEYLGKELVIKSILAEMGGIGNLPQIHFGFVGKGSSAHIIALAVTRKEIKPHIIITRKILLNEIMKTQIGKQLKNA